MRRRELLLFLALAVAPSAATGQVRVQVSLRAYRAPILLDTMTRSFALAATPREVYMAAIAAFEELGIPANTRNEARGIVAATRFSKSRTLGGTQLAQFFECGAGMTGPHANEWRLDIAVAALIDPMKDGSAIVGLAAVASAQDIEGSKQPLVCTPTGQLEEKLFEVIRRKLRG